MKTIKQIRRGHKCRSLVKQVLLSWVNRKNRRRQKRIEKIFELAEEIQGSLEVLAREMARKVGKK